MPNLAKISDQIDDISGLRAELGNMAPRNNPEFNGTVSIGNNATIADSLLSGSNPCTRQKVVNRFGGIAGYVVYSDVSHLPLGLNQTEAAKGFAVSFIPGQPYYACYLAFCRREDTGEFAYLGTDAEKCDWGLGALNFQRMPRLNVTYNYSNAIYHSIDPTGFRASVAMPFVNWSTDYWAAHTDVEWVTLDGITSANRRGRVRESVFDGDDPREYLRAEAIDGDAVVAIGGAVDPSAKITVHGRSSSDRIRLKPQTSLPSDGLDGDIVKLNDGHFYGHNGSTWVQLDN